MTPLERLILEDLPCRPSPDVLPPVTARQAARNVAVLEHELAEWERARHRGPVPVSVPQADGEACALCSHLISVHDFNVFGKYDDASCPACPDSLCRVPQARAS